MIPNKGAIAFAILYLAVAFLVVLVPQLDIWVAQSFFTPGKGFDLAEFGPFLILHWLASKGSWILAIIFLVLAAVSSLRHRQLFSIDRKGWLFLFIALVVGPGLVANVGLKDHWGRARPNQITNFGGTELFSPALVPQIPHHLNGSFVAGDAAFGFFFLSFTCVVIGSARKKRHVFFSGMALGLGLGSMRIAMGGHFLSDVLFAGFFIFLTSFFLYRLIYGQIAFRILWIQLFFEDENKGAL